MIFVAISLCPSSSKDLDIRLINFSVVSVSIGLFFKAIKIDFANLSLSKADFLPFFLQPLFLYTGLFQML